MTTVPQLSDLLADQTADVETAWSLGTFGAIAEFTRDASEMATLACNDSMVSAVTSRGGLRIEAHRDLRPVASESLTSESWSHRVALCLPEATCALSRRTVLTEIGPDHGALRAEDRAAVLFDLGLGALQVDACVRSADAILVAALRRCVGKSVFAPDSDAMRVILAASPHRIFVSRLGRIEVFQPIPPSDGTSPEGPHTHVLPKLLRSGRTHAATEPLPSGWIPCAHFYPPNPIRDGLGHRRSFQQERHEAFQIVLARYGDPRLSEIKQRVIEAVMAGHEPAEIPAADDRFARATVRVALRQLQSSNHLSATLASWLSAYDRGEPVETEESRPVHH